jgi:hypothetical protein
MSTTKKTAKPRPAAKKTARGGAGDLEFKVSPRLQRAEKSIVEAKRISDSALRFRFTV